MDPDPADLQDGDGQRTSARRSSQSDNNRIPPITELIERYAQIENPREDLPYGHPEWYDIRHNLWMEAGQYIGSPYKYFPNRRRLLCGERQNELLMNDPAAPPRRLLELRSCDRKLKRTLVEQRRQSTAAITGASWHNQDCHYRLWPALVPVGQTGTIDMTTDLVNEFYPHAEGVMDVCSEASVEAGHPKHEDPVLGVGPPPSLLGDNVIGLERPLGKRKVAAVYYGDYPPGIEVTEGSVTIGADDSHHSCAECDAQIAVSQSDIAEASPSSWIHNNHWIHNGQRYCLACSPKWKDRPNNTCPDCNPTVDPRRRGPRPTVCTKGEGRRCRCWDCHLARHHAMVCTEGEDKRCQCWDCHWRKLGIQPRADAPGSAADARRLFLGIKKARKHLRDAQTAMREARRTMSALEPIQVGDYPNIQDERHGMSNCLLATEAYMGSTRDYLGSLERKSMTYCIWLAIQQGRYH